MASHSMQSLLNSWRRVPSTFDPGLSEDEFRRIQSAYSIDFPPELRACLADRVPTGPGFPDWRTGSRQHKIWDGSLNSTPLADVLRWPLEGMLFDVEENEFWHPDFGPKPEDAAARERAVVACVTKAPRLIPVYSHRYIPATPCVEGNAVLSVYQTDVIYYGANLLDYLEREFFGSSELPLGDVRRVEFWSDLVEGR